MCPQRGNRRHSDSELYAIPREDELWSIKLKQLEINFNILQERLDVLEKAVFKHPLEFLENKTTWKDRMASWVQGKE